MIYPGNFESKIGFDSILELLRKECLSPLGLKHVGQMSFSTRHGEIIEMLSLTEEFRQVLLSGTAFPNSGYFDLTPELKRIQLKGTYIELENLFDLKTSLQTIRDCLAFFESAEQDQYPGLSAIAKEVEPGDMLLQGIERIMDDKGQIRDTASTALRDIREKLAGKQRAIDGRINKSMQLARKAGLSAEDAEVTIRNGRLVIPVLASSKRQLKGFIHDESASGQTVFIEPTEVFDLNNEIRDLENAERREIINILIAFTDALRSESEVLFKAYEFLGFIDFIRAKAKLALRINGIKPVIKPRPMFNWRNARHPLLHLSHKEQGKEVVPMDLELHGKDRILVISGPNAGGKSVCLKTAGLLQYMLQCGLLVTMEENSEAGIFRDIFLDIGDEQSLENDLSTYSSHLMNIREFITHAGRDTFFLIDEFGSGTEPHLGGAIAEAALHGLNRSKAYGLITTHYANIKLMADREAGIINGAMLFDTRALKPLYLLRTGKPGSSFAFEIARDIGFPENILDEAASITGYSQLDFEKQLQELETEKMQLEQQKQKYDVADEFLSETIDKYERLIRDLNARKAEVIDEARREAAEILSGANRAIEHTIKGIREAEAEKDKTKKLRKDLKDKTEKILDGKAEKKAKSEATNKAPASPSPDREARYISGVPKEGDLVEISPYGTSGEVIEVKGKKATVSSGSVNIKVPLKDLKKLRKDQKPESMGQKRKAYGSIMNDINRRAANFNPSIDLRGKRALEALDDLKMYIDDAILLSVKEVSILHGKGDGILRNVLREYLQTLDDVEQISDAHVERGGQGITIVKFR